MKSYAITDIGVHRKMNQDFYYAFGHPVGNLPNLFVVADGMGGHNAGEYASMHAVDMIVATAEASFHTRPAEVLDEAIRKANEGLLRKAASDTSMWGMGTTVVAAVICGSRLHIANVGDSRLYILNNGIRQITRDHSFVEEMVRRGEIDRESAKNHPDKNIITRAVGVMQEIKVDFFEEALMPEDKILLCSDGLTNMVEDSEIYQIIQAQNDAAEAAAGLILAANRNGGKDNITVIVIDPFGV